MPIWDLPLRLFHWLLVIAVVAAYLSGIEGGLWLEWHIQLGVFILALLGFRLVWGFVGTTHARFANFFPTPARLRAYARSDWHVVGHNPLGAIWIFAVLTCLLLQAGSGLFAINDEVETHGPLYALVSADWSERLTGWHGRFVDLLLIMVGLHLVAISCYAGFQKKNLLMPMVTGRVAMEETVHVEPIHGAGAFRLLLAVVLAVLVFWTLDSGALPYWLSTDSPALHQRTPTQSFMKPAWWPTCDGLTA